MPNASKSSLANDSDVKPANHYCGSCGKHHHFEAHEDKLSPCCPSYPCYPLEGGQRWALLPIR